MYFHPKQDKKDPYECAEGSAYGGMADTIVFWVVVIVIIAATAWGLV